MVVDGLEWIPTGEVCRRLAPDVSANTLRNWWRAGRVRLLRDPTGRPVRLDRQFLLCWTDVIEAEHAARTTPLGGRPRTNVGEPLQ